jgi:CDP-4-dehydro-6-deoxyglucose reductase, E3
LILFEAIAYEALRGETILECLTRHGVTVPSFCRNGACQTCVMKVSQGEAPARGQVGLRRSLAKKGYVLTCICPAEDGLSLERCDSAPTFTSRVLQVEAKSPSVCLVQLERPAAFSFEAGQFVQVQRPEDGVERPYSIASTPNQDTLELHVAVYPEGELSPWLARALGQTVHVRGPFGDFSYLEGTPDAPLLMAATGTGLAPVLGVLRRAFECGHRGPVHLYHGSRTASGLYHSASLDDLVRNNPNLRATEVFLEPSEASPLEAAEVRRLQGDLKTLVLSEHPHVAELRAYLAGAPDIVHRLRKALYLQGANLEQIHADLFFGRGDLPT